MLPLVVLSLLCGTSRTIGISASLFGGFMLIFGINILYGIQTGISAEITGPHLAFFLKFICFYLLAIATPWEKGGFQRACRISLMLISIVVFSSVAFYGSSFSIELNMDSDRQMDYQGMAFAYLVISLGALHGAGGIMRILLYLLSVPVLFFIGARAEFVAFFLIVGVIEYFLTKSKALFFLQLTSALLLIAAAAVLTQNIAENNRIFNLLDIEQDESAIERADLSRDAMRTIQRNPVIGDYGSYAPGKYAHNLLSAWVDLGLLGFALLNLMFVAALLDMYYKRRKRNWGELLAPSLAMLVATYFLMMLAKSYTYQLIPIALGTYLHMHARVSKLRFSRRAP